MKKIRRGKYLDKIYKVLEKEKLVLILGPRQVGKTTLLLTLKEETNLPVFYYSFEDEFSKLEFKNKTDFISFFQTTLGVDFYSEGLLLLDEFQYVKHNSKILKSLYDDNKIKVKLIVTGSGIWSMKEDQSSLVGRGQEIFVWGFDFFEFLETKGLNVKNFSLKNYTSSLENVFLTYYEEFVKYGAYPAVVLANSHEEKILNLEKIIQKYIEKDVGFFLMGQELLDFKKFFVYLTGGIGNLIKIDAISSYLGIKASIVKKFLSILEKTLFIYPVYPFFTDKFKEYTKHPKIYFHDVGIINFLSKNFNSFDYGKLNENLVLTELLKNRLFNSDEIKTYKKISKSEIDFIYDGLTRFVPIEVKSNNSLQIPKIFYSFEKQYGEKVSFYVRTTQSKWKEKILNEKKVYFVPNYLVGKILDF